MDWLVWSGSAATSLGVIALGWCILTVMRARRSGLEDSEMRMRLGRVLPINMGALFLSAVGLAMVTVGILLS